MPSATRLAAALEISERSGSTRTERLRGDRIILGRSRAVDLHIEDPTVSRRHAEIFRDPFGRWWIRDLGSRFGTSVNGETITERMLSGGEEIRAGDCRLRFQAAGPNVVEVPLRTAIVGDESGLLLTTLRESEPPAVNAAHLSEILELGTRLMHVADEQDRRQCLCDLMVRRSFHGTAALVLRVNPQQVGEPPAELARAEGPTLRADHAGYVSRSLLTAVCRSREPSLASNAPMGKVDVNLSLSPAQMRTAAVACPLGEHPGALDLLYVHFPPEFGTAEWLSLASLSVAQYRQADAAWKLRERDAAHQVIERELLRAREIQNGLLPQETPLPGLDVAIGFAPCRWVGGDYVDTVPLPNGSVLLAVADVSGKGLAAAMTTGNLHAIVHAHVGEDFNLSQLMRHLNTYLDRHLPDDAFVTMLALQIDPRSGEYEVVNAGHPRPMLAAPGAELAPLPAPAYPPLSVLEAPFEATRGRLPAGARLFLFTDGATDVCDEQDVRLELDGLLEMLARTVRELPDAPAAEIVRRLNASLDQYQGQSLPADDRTFLVARWSGA